MSRAGFVTIAALLAFAASVAGRPSFPRIVAVYNNPEFKADNLRQLMAQAQIGSKPGAREWGWGCRGSVFGGSRPQWLAGMV